MTPPEASLDEKPGLTLGGLKKLLANYPDISDDAEIGLYMGGPAFIRLRDTPDITGKPHERILLHPIKYIPAPGVNLPIPP